MLEHLDTERDLVYKFLKMNGHSFFLVVNYFMNNGE